MGRRRLDPSGVGVVIGCKVPERTRSALGAEARRHGLTPGAMLRRIVTERYEQSSLPVSSLAVEEELDFLEIVDEVVVAEAEAQLQPEVVVPASLTMLTNRDGVFADIEEDGTGDRFTFQLADRSVAARLLERKCYIVLMTGPGGGE